MKKPHITKDYVRYRIMNPSYFQSGSLRTQDIERVGHSKRIAGILKSTGEWATQAILIHRNDYEEGYRVKLKGGRPTIVKIK